MISTFIWKKKAGKYCCLSIRYGTDSLALITWPVLIAWALFSVTPILLCALAGPYSLNSLKEMPEGFLQAEFSPIMKWIPIGSCLYSATETNAQVIMCSEHRFSPNCFHFWCWCLSSEVRHQKWYLMQQWWFEERSWSCLGFFETCGRELGSSYWHRYCLLNQYIMFKRNFPYAISPRTWSVPGW